MDVLSAEEARVLGALVEKAFTTPDQYPLTTNALVSACNQRSNRHPVVDYDPETVESALRGLDDRGLAGMTRASGGRTVRYVHRIQQALDLDDEQASLTAVLLLRGPQTPGELRSRTDRYVSFTDVGAVEERLIDLMTRDAPLVERLERAPGQKEHRYRTLLTDAVDVESTGGSGPTRAGRIELLEARIARIERELGLEPLEEE